MKPIEDYILEYNDGSSWELFVNPQDRRLSQIAALPCVNYIWHGFGDYHRIDVSKRYSPADFERAVAEIFSKENQS